MLFTLAMILIFGLILSGIFQKMRLPGLMGMLLTGILLGPYALDWISPGILAISSDLRQIALIIILARAGLALDLKDLKKIGRPAFLMCFLPSTIEIIAVTLLAPLLFGIPTFDAILLGCVLAAVSPAIVVPRMIKLAEGSYSKEHRIPQLILAGASVDIVFILVLFTAFAQSYQGKTFGIAEFLRIPLSIASGVLLGAVAGLGLVWIFKKIHIRDTVKILILLGLSFLFVSLEAWIKPYFAVSGLISIMSMGVVILKQYETLGLRLSYKFSKIWVGAEILLFVLVGATVEISRLPEAGLLSLVLILGALLFRGGGVFLSLIKTPLNRTERLFCAIAYLPKATVQAAIGGIPLAMGLASGPLILAIAVVAILFTAPLGAVGMDLSYKKLLSHSEEIMSTDDEIET